MANDTVRFPKLVEAINEMFAPEIARDLVNAVESELSVFGAVLALMHALGEHNAFPVLIKAGWARSRFRNTVR